MSKYTRRYIGGHLADDRQPFFSLRPVETPAAVVCAYGWPWPATPYQWRIA